MASALLHLALRKFRTAWMASLSHPRVLDNDVIELPRFEGQEMIDFGPCTVSWETREATTRAIQDWSKETTGAAQTALVSATAAPLAAPPGPPAPSPV